jgi:hypothetical protein
MSTDFSCSHILDDISLSSNLVTTEIIWNHIKHVVALLMLFKCIPVQELDPLQLSLPPAIHENVML